MFRQSRNSVEDVWGARTPYDGEGNWPPRVDEQLDEEPQHWVQSACVLCANGCALDIGVKDNRIVGVRGRGVDRSNRGRLGPKGLFGWRANQSPDRLVHPLIRDKNGFRAASWNEAMNLIVGRAQEVRDHFTGGAIGFYTSGQLFLEEYYTLSLIAHGGLGTNHLDGNTRLCTATASVAMRETFGSDGQPGSYTDFDSSACLFVAGSDMAFTKTVLWMRILDRRRGPRPPRLIVVDPWRTATAGEADVHLAPRAGTNVAVLNGLLHLVLQSDGVDRTLTNPAVSLSELHRIRKILRRDGLFVVVEDAFLMEMAQLADVVLPAAIWGEKTGYGQRDTGEPSALRKEMFGSTRVGALGLLRDLQDLFVLASQAQIFLTTVLQAAQALWDQEMLAACLHWQEQNKRQLAWLNTEIMHRAAHVLVVPS